MFIISQFQSNTCWSGDAAEGGNAHVLVSDAKSQD